LGWSASIEERPDGNARWLGSAAKALYRPAPGCNEEWANALIKADIGLDVRGTPLPASICAHAILQPDLFSPDRRFATRVTMSENVFCDPGRIGQVLSNLLGTRSSMAHPARRWRSRCR
jgi:hypothetical protein